MRDRGAKVKNMFKVKNEDTQATSNDIVVVSLLQPLNILPTFSPISVADFEQINCLIGYLPLHILLL